MQFFEFLGSSSNFAIQSGNSLMKVAHIEDYKVFLNPGLILDKAIARGRVVDLWCKQKWFGDDKILKKFSDFLKKPVRDSSDLERLLRENDKWFDEIFTNNLS